MRSNSSIGDVVDRVRTRFASPLLFSARLGPIMLRREEPMRNMHCKWKIVLLGALTSFASSAAGQPAGTPPDFSFGPNAAWVGIGVGEIRPVPGSPLPIMQDPAHPYVSQDEANDTGKQPTERMGDVSNPNLRDWAREVMRAENEQVAAGKFAYTARAACRSAGVPGFDVMTSGAMYILQSPDKVTLIHDGNADMRHIWLNGGHFDNLRPTGYGESVGHYEGDALVVDTIGLKDDTYLDNWRTPHSNKLHVQERWRLIENGTQLEVLITIEDPETFYEPWQGLRTYRRINREFEEEICAENSGNHWSERDYGIPETDKREF
jgi:hypothetical protein